jgi:hypothetical protein
MATLLTTWWLMAAIHQPVVQDTTPTRPALEEPGPNAADVAVHVSQRLRQTFSWDPSVAGWDFLRDVWSACSGCWGQLVFFASFFGFTFLAGLAGMAILLVAILVLLAVNRASL